jgi:hypothetical protein
MDSRQNLIRHPRFLALFIVQFFGAFNDNLFKNALGDVDYLPNYGQ